MIDLGPHAAYIIGAYAGVALVLAALIVMTVRDSRHQKQRLSELEQAGIRRRSSGDAA